MKRLTIIVGAGGTGSYFIPSILRQYDKNFLDNKVIVMDGDFLEEKNLLRQGFFKDVINYSKSEAMYKMHSPYFRGLLECRTQFLNFADDLTNIIHSEVMDYQEVVLVSCVDNNLARLRLFVGQQLIKNLYPEINVLFVDSGNEEWNGQSLVSYLGQDDKPLINFTKNALEIIPENINVEKVDSIFPRIADWQNHLTRGDHEMSCDDNVVSHPQNIATNMMASNTLLFTINNVFERNIVKNIRFDTVKNTTAVIERLEQSEIETFLEQLVEFLKSEEGQEVISPAFTNFNAESETIFVKEPVVLEVVKSQEPPLTVIPFNDIKEMLKTKTTNRPTPVVPKQPATDEIKLPTELSFDLEKELGLNTEFDFDLSLDDISNIVEKDATAPNLDLEIKFDELFS